MKQQLLLAHMQTAYVYANLSHCKRKKVGCVIVRNNKLISIGYNGTPPGWDNCCEDEHNATFPFVIHAEANAILKLAGDVGGGSGSTVFITCAPCLECAKLIAGMGAASVFYGESYRDTAGIDYLLLCGIPSVLLPIE